MGILDLVKNSKDSEGPKPISSLDIFDSLIHKEGYGYLRSNQKDFLTAWEKKRDQKDVVGILNTGAGKTLVGLLMLLSKMNEGIGPCIYLCPNKQLVEQVVKQASNHNIPVVKINEKNALPIEFLNSQSILITTFERLFNGKSIFGVAGYGDRDIESLGSLLIDDAHSCVKKARNQVTIKIKKSSIYYKQFWEIFKHDLEKQSSGQFLSIERGSYSVSKMIPYWSWKDNQSKVKDIINDMYEDGASEITFSHNLIIDYLDSCQCYISGNELEITPLRIPVEKVPAYNNAKHRFILSATFSNNSDLVNELDIDVNSVQNPIEIKNISDVGERMILAPSKYHSDINREFIGKILKAHSANHNIVVLAPTYKQAKKWENYGAKVIQNDIDDEIENLNNTQGNFVVFVNRYDGIDLSGDSCHFLVIDGIPKGETVKEKSHSIMRPDSNYLLSQKAQSIEQGLGRAVRSGSDYCVVFMLGDDLLNFISRKTNLKFFSEQTQSQLDLTLTLIQEVKSSSTWEEAWTEVKTAVNLCLERDAGWTSMYKDNLKKYAETSHNTPNLLSLAQKEHLGLILYSNQDYEASYAEINSIITDSLLVDSQEKGWYYQILAEIMYSSNKTRSNDLQIKALKNNGNLLKPIHPTKEKKRKSTSSQAQKSLQEIQNFTSNMDLMYFVRNSLSNLIYSENQDSKLFEKSIWNLGTLLGFESTTPEKTLDDGGPDNLWRSPEYSLIIECKNNAINGVVSKSDLNQLSGALNWYKERYILENDYCGIFFHPYYKIDRRGSFSSEMKVVPKEKFELLKKNVEAFVEKLSNKNLSEWSANEIDQLLNDFHLRIKSFINHYTVELKK